ncbi:30S ribosomal protein S9 [archaeon]|jgi:small subunit ribosomal protein S9|nr:30S ribosomal protein S9 [Candidatus Woesearchaeota archaeon]MBT4135686.1 30S ribosomal protein S9 [archaeon]MBT4242047.1 30S ribosomal protein S9 [archaeon]MBT4417735.1 30S ribosomal protein S9 [archaeon]
MAIEKNLTVSGKRKTAIAKATIKTGKGKITVNKIPYEHLDMFKRLTIKEPIELTKKTLGNFDFDIAVNIKGGGSEGQIQAGRLAIAKALVEFTKSKELKQAFISYDKNLLVADTRRKEPNKPGDSKARRKRQKSFR